MVMNWVRQIGLSWGSLKLNRTNLRDDLSMLYDLKKPNILNLRMVVLWEVKVGLSWGLL